MKFHCTGKREQYQFYSYMFSSFNYLELYFIVEMLPAFNQKIHKW